ncbi:MAG: enoyl-CoA hydratase-related protein [Acidobacteriota bacterium]
MSDQPFINKTFERPLGEPPRLGAPIPTAMQALVLHRDRYGAPRDVLRCESVATPRLTPADAGRVLVELLASGPNFNTNFAALGLPVPVFGRGDAATIHVPGSDALGIVVDAGPAVTSVAVGDAVILDSWTGNSIRGYETHDGFNAQFAVLDAQRALPLPTSLKQQSPEQLAAMMLTYGTAYRCIVERLGVDPGDSVLILGGGKGTSYAGAQIAKALGARVVLMGSNQTLGEELIDRGVADAFVNRREIPAEVYGVLDTDETESDWLDRTEPFRDAVFAANGGQPVNAVFEHTGGRNFPLLVSALADGGRLAFFGATGQGLKGEYKETFFAGGRRYVLDARWVWMRQKQVLFRRGAPSEIFDEIDLPPGRRGVIWGADERALAFALAAQERSADLAFLVSRADEAGVRALLDAGVDESRILDTGAFRLDPDMPDPLRDDGTPNPDYDAFMDDAKAIGRAIWGVFGPRVSPDFIVDRADQSTLHYSTFLARDFDENDALPSGYVVVSCEVDLDVRGSHMYHASQASEVMRLLAEERIVLQQEDLDIVGLEELAEVQQKMLDGTMTKPKGVALVQADRAGRSIADFEEAFLGTAAQASDPRAGRFVDLRVQGGVALITLDRPAALNALSEELLGQLGDVVEQTRSGKAAGESVDAVVLRGSGRAFVAGADIQVFMNKSAAELEALANANMAVFTALEDLAVPVVSLIDGFALGGGNELALATHYRLVTQNAALGQPEIKLGIIPGYGGMQRLPRVIGPRKAAEMSVNGESIGAQEALRCGLAHEACSSSTALARAWQVARDLASGDLPFERPRWDEAAGAARGELEELLADESVQSLLASPAPDDPSDLEGARRFAARIALEALRDGFGLDFAKGLANDARLFGEVTASPSGQCWAGKFLAKDPAQQTFLTLLPPAGLGGRR